MGSVIVELAVNLVQAFMFTSFLYLFFDKPEGKLKRAIPYFVLVMVLFLNVSYFTLSGVYIASEIMYLDSIIAVVSMLIYSLIFLRGKLYLRIIMPIITFLVNAGVSYTFGYMVSFFTGLSFEEGFADSPSYRYFCLVVVNLTMAMVYWLILKFGSKRIRLNGAREAVFFIVVPLMCLVIIHCMFYVYQIAAFNSKLMPFIVIICGSVVILAVLVWIILLKMSKANEIKTEYLLMSQREKLYEESILATNKQVEIISGIKHDMKNKLFVLERLISNSETQQALELCSDTLGQLASQYTPVNTDDPVLNAIMNVELEKASGYSIEFSLNICESLSQIASEDKVSLIGNLCDNAIEYLRTQPLDLRSMSLQISSRLDYIIITCRNRISESVLLKNPDFITTKEDKVNHGKGVRIIKRIAKKYNGEISMTEENGWFVAAVFLKCKE